MLRSWFALGLVTALSSGGCTLAAQLNGSSVVVGDAHGGVVSRVTTFTQAGVMNMANAWCGQYRLVALETQAMFGDESMRFACVPSPS